MRLERSKNAARNFVFGTFAKVFNMLTPFIMRTVFIYTLGINYLGLGSVFASILQVLNLAELGVGSALVYSMYKPLADDDEKKICALMNLYKRYYRIIGLVILAVGLLLMPFLKYLIKTDLPEDINLYVLYVLALAGTVVSYWLYAYKISILYVYQRTDIVSKIGMAVSTARIILQATALIIFKNYYLFQIIALLFNVLYNVVSALIVKKYYPQYRPEGQLDQQEIREINKKVRALFISKIGNVLINASDSIIISTFIGLNLVAIYQNYYTVMNGVMGFITIIAYSSLAGIGNSIKTETQEKNYNDFIKINFVIMWLTVFSVCCFTCLYQPFISLWTGKENLLSYDMVIWFCIYFFLNMLYQAPTVYKDAAGIWHKDRYRPLVTALVNVTVNIILVNFLGIQGIIISTVVSLIFVGIPWLLRNVFTAVFHENPKYYLYTVIRFAVLSVVTAAVCVFITNRIMISSLILTIIVRLAVCIVIPNTVMFILFRRTKEFMQVLLLINHVIPKRLKRLDRYIESHPYAE